MQILIVEDEIRLAEALSHILTEQKYQTDTVYNGNDGLDYALSGIYDVIILDIMLPGKDGFQVVSELRKKNINTPVLMLTAKSGLEDKISGLDSGADDYMTKPFEPGELLARVRALTRRQGDVILDELKYGDIVLSLSSCDISHGTKSVHLNFKEFEILKLLMASPETPITKEELIVKVWGYDSDATDNNVEAYISFLRKKLSFIGSDVQITALRKIGYRLISEEHQKA